jgi:CMP-N-acetylneuraminic acid synthetase
MLIIIPARRGSNRLPGKNIRSFETVGETQRNIVERTILQAVDLEGTIVVTSDVAPRDLFGRIVVPDTKFEDCPECYEIAGANNMKRRIVFHDRASKRHLNTSETRSEDVIEDVLFKYDAESFVLMQPTSPIRDVRHLLTAERLFKNNDIPALISLNESYQPNGSFYFVRTEDFLEQKTIYVRGASFYILHGRENIDIDYIHNFRIAQAANEDRIYGDK